LSASLGSQPRSSVARGCFRRMCQIGRHFDTPRYYQSLSLNLHIKAQIRTETAYIDKKGIRLEFQMKIFNECKQILRDPIGPITAEAASLAPGLEGFKSDPPNLRRHVSSLSLGHRQSQPEKLLDIAALCKQLVSHISEMAGALHPPLSFNGRSRLLTPLLESQVQCLTEMYLLTRPRCMTLCNMLYVLNALFKQK
jgi:hypothetical protein